MLERIKLASVMTERREEDSRMSLPGGFIGEFLRWGALCFVAPVGWERPKHGWRRSSIQRLPAGLFLTVAVSLAGLIAFTIEAIYVPGFPSFSHF